MWTIFAFLCVVVWFTVGDTFAVGGVVGGVSGSERRSSEDVSTDVWVSKAACAWIESLASSTTGDTIMGGASDNAWI